MMAAAPVPVIAAAVAVALWALYRWLLPKPIPGIPYNQRAARSLLGDIPGLIGSKQLPSDWLVSQIRKHRSPIVQVFLEPFGRPSIVLMDFRESQDIMMRRKEFDRSKQMIEFFKGLLPKHHIVLKTDATFKAHRRLLQDLMTPSFLHKVAAPSIYANAQDLVTLWKAKAAIADGRPFSAADDVFYAALDAVFAFSFGASYPHRSTAAQLKSISRVDAQSVRSLPPDAAVPFPVEPLHETSQAIIDLVGEVQQVTHSPSARLAWWWLKRTAAHRRAARVRDACIKDQVEQAVARLESHEAVSAGADEGDAKSAVDLMMDRERRFAAKEGRKPIYWSDVMRDEVFGFVVAGHDTTSTTLLWGLKFLAANTAAQTALRKALECAHRGPLEGKRDPTATEIAETTIPYLDATIEEILRCAGTAPLLGRDAEADTTVLGHHIPKGTSIMMVHNAATTTAGYPIDEVRRSPSSQAAAKERGVREWDPEGMSEFRPERWLAPGQDAGGSAFDPTAGPMLAFGLGIRACFGKRLAYLEMRLILTLLIWNFEMLPCPDELSGFEAVDGVTHKPTQTYVRLKRTR